MTKQKGRDCEKGGVFFYIGNCTPRRNEYEKGIKYFLSFSYDGLFYNPTGWRFSTIKEAKTWINENYFIFL